MTRATKRPVTISTLADFRRHGMNIWANCARPQCSHGAKLNLEGLIDRFGPDYEPVGNTAIQRSVVCQGRDAHRVARPCRHRRRCQARERRGKLMDHDADMRLQEEMERDFINLAHWWEAHGHTPADVAVALLGLAMARVEMLAANGETEEAIRRARATVARPGS